MSRVKGVIQLKSSYPFGFWTAAFAHGAGYQVYWKFQDTGYQWPYFLGLDQLSFPSQWQWQVLDALFRWERQPQGLIVVTPEGIYDQDHPFDLNGIADDALGGWIRRAWEKKTFHILEPRDLFGAFTKVFYRVRLGQYPSWKKPRLRSQPEIPLPKDSTGWVWWCLEWISAQNPVYQKCWPSHWVFWKKGLEPAWEGFMIFQRDFENHRWRTFFRVPLKWDRQLRSNHRKTLELKDWILSEIQDFFSFLKPMKNHSQLKRWWVDFGGESIWDLKRMWQWEYEQWSSAFKKRLLEEEELQLKSNLRQEVK